MNLLEIVKRNKEGEQPSIPILQGGGEYNNMSVSQRQDYIKNYLRGKGGLSDVQIASIIGNLKQENYNFGTSQQGKTLGIAQWRGDRQKNLLKWNNPTDINTQLNFLLHEIKTGDGFRNKSEQAKFLNSNTIEEATKNFGELYERAGSNEMNMSNRIKYANNAFGKSSWNWGKKNSNVNVEGLNSGIISYISTLPKNLQDKILATAGSDGKHSKNSRHYSGNAIDLRFDQEVWNHIEKDPNRQKYGITLLDPNHGTAKHIHMSTGTGSENRSDVFFKDIPEQTKYYTSDVDTSSNEAYQKAMIASLTAQTESQLQLNQAQVNALQIEQQEKLALQEENKQKEANEQAQAVLEERSKQKEALLEIGLQTIPQHIEYEATALNSIASSPINFQYQGGFEKLIQAKNGGVFHNIYESYGKPNIDTFKSKFIK